MWVFLGGAGRERVQNNAHKRSRLVVLCYCVSKIQYSTENLMFSELANKNLSMATVPSAGKLQHCQFKPSLETHLVHKGKDRKEAK